MVAYDTFTGRKVLHCMKFLEKTQWWKKKDIHRLQLRRMKRLLRYAYENVPYYHTAFKEASFHPADFRALTDLHKLPILTKSILREQNSQLQSRTTSRHGMVAMATTGTTASPVGFSRSRIDISWGTGAEFRGYGWAGYELGKKIILVWRLHPHDTRKLKFKIREILKRERVLNVSSLSEQSLASFTAEMRRFNPDFIRGVCSSTNILALFLKDNGASDIQPKAVFTTGETLLPHYRRAIESLGCKVYDQYASCEMSFMASQCGHHAGLHVHDENLYLEVEQDNEPAAPGEEGRVLLTNLHSHAMPFIRYDIGDMGTVLDDSCSCGRQLTLFTPIGRIYEYFYGSDGSFTILRDLPTVFEDLPIQDFQVVQETLDDITIKIVPRREYNQSHTDFILKHVRGVHSKSAIVRVELVKSLPLGHSGKMSHAVSKIATKYT
jgi:phenylacetate-CoA ligase